MQNFESGHVLTPHNGKALHHGAHFWCDLHKLVCTVHQATACKSKCWCCGSQYMGVGALAGGGGLLGSHYHQTLCWAEYTLALVKVVPCPAIFIMLRPCTAVHWDLQLCNLLHHSIGRLRPGYDIPPTLYHPLMMLRSAIFMPCCATLATLYHLPSNTFDMLFSCNKFHWQHLIIPKNSLGLFKLWRPFELVGWLK